MSDASQAQIHSPPKEVKKWAQGGQMIIRFTWDVVGEDKRVCSLDIGFDIGLWDKWTFNERQLSFMDVAKERCATNSQRMPDQLKAPILADLLDFANAYDWDTDRKVVASYQ